MCEIQFFYRNSFQAPTITPFFSVDSYIRTTIVEDPYLPSPENKFLQRGVDPNSADPNWLYWDSKPLTDPSTTDRNVTTKIGVWLWVGGGGGVGMGVSAPNTPVIPDLPDTPTAISILEDPKDMKIHLPLVDEV